MRSSTPKVLHPVCGRPMLGYVLDAAQAATGNRPTVVISPPVAQVADVFAGAADFAIQAEPRGTADAVATALRELPTEVREILVLSGDVPLVDADVLLDLVEARRDVDAAVALISVDMEDPAALGRVTRDAEGRTTRVVEFSDATEEQRGITEINAGLYAFDAEWLRLRIGEVEPSPVSGELYLPELIPLARRDDRAVVTLEVEDDGTLLGINDRRQLADAELEMRLRILEAHMAAGVTMLDPSTTYIDQSVRIAEDVTLEPNVVLRGQTVIERDAVIRAGSQVFDTTVGERTVVWASVLEGATVDADATIGPFSHVRKGSYIGPRVELGNFAEVKNSTIGAGTKSHHFSYLGDAEVGERVNIGAGSITANYDGRMKHRTKIGDGAFIGSDTIMRAPVTVGAGAYTGAASRVTRDVPDGEMALGVPARIRERHAQASKS
ncbi:MAG: bifunctional UDP-N-acetylglucosamine diphosphorylase/glucosamine-1-phosphate N-acetyltransferase GlmU, partial [Candidatus Limnocylindrales bacterium]